MNKNSGYILATKTLRTNRIVRIINHKTHIKRTNNTLYKRLYECKRREVLDASLERYDIMAVNGNCALMSVLSEAGVDRADVLIASTSADEINLLC